MTKRNPSGNAKYMQDLGIELENSFEQIKKEFANNLYKEMPVFSGYARDHIDVSRTRRDGRKIWVEVKLPPYMWEVWKGIDVYYYARDKKMKFPAWKWTNGPANSGVNYIKFKFGKYYKGFYYFTQVHHKVEGVEKTDKDFIQNAFDKLDLSKFTQGIVTKMNNRKIYL